MSGTPEHIKDIDEFSKKLAAMGAEGHLNGFYANTYAGAAQTELSKLREFLAKNLTNHNL